MLVTAGAAGIGREIARSFGLSRPLDHVAEVHRAMDKRRAIKASLCP